MTTERAIGQTLASKSNPHDGTVQIKFKTGEFCIDINDLISNLTPDQQRIVAQYECFNEVLQEALVGALVEGYVYDDGWFIGGETYDNLRKRLLPLAPLAIRKLLDSQVRKAEREETYKDRWRDLCWKMARTWNDRKHAADRVEDRIEYDSPQWPTKERIEAMIREVDESYIDEIRRAEGQLRPDRVEELEVV